MDLKETLEGYCNRLDNHIRSIKTNFQYTLDSVAETLLYKKSKINATLNNSEDVGTLNTFGVLRQQGQMIESRSMEIVTLAETLKDLRKILAEGE